MCSNGRWEWFVFEVISWYWGCSSRLTFRSHLLLRIRLSGHCTPSAITVNASLPWLHPLIHKWRFSCPVTVDVSLPCCTPSPTTYPLMRLYLYYNCTITDPVTAYQFSLQRMCLSWNYIPFPVTKEMTCYFTPCPLLRMRISCYRVYASWCCRPCLVNEDMSPPLLSTFPSYQVVLLPLQDCEAHSCCWGHTSLGTAHPLLLLGIHIFHYFTSCSITEDLLLLLLYTLPHYYGSTSPFSAHPRLLLHIQVSYTLITQQRRR